MGSIPYVPPMYQRQPTRIADLLMLQGQQQGEAARRSGEIWGNAISGIGQNIGQAIQQAPIIKLENERAKRFEAQSAREEEKFQAAQAEQDQLNKQDAAFMDYLSKTEGQPDPKKILSIYGPERGLRIAQGFKAFSEIGEGKEGEALKNAPTVVRGFAALSPQMQAQTWPAIRQQALNTGLFTPDALPEQYSSEVGQRMIAWGSSLEKPNAAAAKAPETTDFGGVKHQWDAATNTWKPLGKSEAALTREAKGPESEPLVAIMGPDGQPVLVPRGQAAGKRPASTREQGRAVPAGEADKITELTTSLDDVAKVRTALEGGATGAASKLGVMLPNVVSEFTGLGAESKATQATIDRVKQVIGKALEGGVLRKEDESKYEKILPTIGDPPAVVKAKLDGLESALKLRRDRQIEGLSDAGYDTSQFLKRLPAASPGGSAGREVTFNPQTGKLE